MTVCLQDPQSVNFWIMTPHELVTGANILQQHSTAIFTSTLKMDGLHLYTYVPLRSWYLPTRLYCHNKECCHLNALMDSYVLLVKFTLSKKLPIYDFLWFQKYGLSSTDLRTDGQYLVHVHRHQTNHTLAQAQGLQQRTNQVSLDLVALEKCSLH